MVAQTQQSLLQRLAVRVLQVEELVRYALLFQTRVGAILQPENLTEFALRQDGRIQHHLLGMLLRRHEHVALGANLRRERHDNALAQRVDRRVRHLRKLLAEIIVERAHLVRQHRHRRVVTHGAHGFALVFSEYADNFVAFLSRDVEHLLVERERFAIERLSRQTRVDEVALEIAHALLQPRLVRVAVLQQVIDPRVVHQLARLQVQHQHLARPELALAHHVFRTEIPHAHFRGDGEMAVLRDDPTRGTQTVAVERASGIATIGGDDACRPIPRLHVRRVEFVERTEVRVERIHALPRRRDEQT